MRQTRQENRCAARRRAFVLVIVLIVVAVLSLTAYSFTQMMVAHSEATEIMGRQSQALLLASSGVEYLRAFLMQDTTTQAEAGGSYDNPDSFQAVSVSISEGSEEQGRFTVLAPLEDVQSGSVGGRYGLENESARLNINALLVIEEVAKEAGQENLQGLGLEDVQGLDLDNLGRDLLMALPGMTEDVADAILDWMDADDELRDYGAESGDYTDYAPKNGPLETVEELLLVRGVTPDLLFGYDVNRNGLIDANEMGGTGGTTDTTFRGWSAYLTLHSKEDNINSLGEPRIDLNTNDMQALHDSLSLVLEEEWVTFIIAYRQNGEYEENEAAEPYSGGELDFSQPGKDETKLTQVLDLIGKKVQVKFVGDEEETILASPFKEDLLSMNTYMTTLMDNVTVVSGETIPGRININQASRDILVGIPGLSEEAVEQIISLRSMDPSLDDTSRRHETWLLTEGIVTLSEMRSLMPLICAGGDVYRAQVVGYYDDGQASARLEVVLDATQSPPRILLWRDISHLGRGHALETLGVGLGGAMQ